MFSRKTSILHLFMRLRRGGSCKYAGIEGILVPETEQQPKGDLVSKLCCYSTCIGSLQYPVQHFACTSYAGLT